jgi:hypothetical protein
MRTHPLQFRLLLLLILAWAVAPAADAPVFAAKRVVILVIDGPRWTETFGEPTRQYVPVQDKELLPQGVFFSDFANDGPTYTNAGHTALVTGFHQEINNNGLELPANPVLFQRWLKQSGAPATDAWVVSSKDKLQILTDCSAVGWRHQWVCSFDCGKGGAGVGAGYRDDATTRKRALEVLREHKPHAMLINLKEPDASGHAKNWEGFLQGIRDGDAFAGELWKLLRDEAPFAGETALFITNDHGRHLDGHKDGFVSHGDDCPGCHHIQLVALGPGFRKGAVVARHGCQLDVAVTAAAILGLEHTGSQGRVLTELVSEPTAAPAAPTAAPGQDPAK